MSITELGIEGEKLARDVLKEWGYELFQSDWLAYRNGQYITVQVKRKERFEPPPFEGHGLEIYQVRDRISFYERTGIRPLLLIIEIPSDVIYYEWLDLLESGDFFDTKNGIRVYPLENFETINLANTPDESVV